MRIIDLLESIKSSQEQDVKLFFVTRAIKAGATKRTLANRLQRRGSIVFV